MQTCQKKIRSKGSITVEACIILPAFLSVFFLLLFLIKFTCTGMILDYAVNETAKEIAASAYPIAFINETEDEKLGEYRNVEIPTPEAELEKLVEEYDKSNYSSILNLIISKDWKGEEASDAIKGILEDYGKGIIGSAIEVVAPAYWNMKSAGKYMIADSIIREHLESPLIHSDNVKLRLAEFPQGRGEYEARLENKAYKGISLTPDKDFNNDDVVIQLEYSYKVKLPFAKSLNIKMVHTAVEKAWINGSHGTLTAEEEGLNLEPEGNVVFITRTGIRYHKGSCWHLRKSRIPVNIGDAQAQGYTPCKVCKPLEQKQ